MTWLMNLVRGVRCLFQKQSVDRELEEELDGYFEASVAQKQRCGMTLEAARRAAHLELGSRNALKHKVWSSRWESAVEGIVQDLRVSLRGLAKNTGFTVVALLSLALGIGGNTAIFTLINQVLLRNLPVREPEQLFAFGTSESAGIAGGIDLGAFGGFFPWDFARQLQANPGPFEGIAGYCSFSDKVSIRVSSPVNSADTPALLAPANLVSGNYFSVLGARPLLGRTILPSDDTTPGTGAVVVLSYHFWQNALSSDPHVVGRSININGTAFEVVGVMREGFHGIKQELEPVEVWMPVSMQAVVFQSPSMLTPHSGLYFLHAFGRVHPAAVSSKTELANYQAWLDQQVRNGIREREGSAITAARQQEIGRANVPLVPAPQGVSMIRSEYGVSLKILMGVVGLVLLIACANLANFLLARATTRQHETATRLALGSSRARIVRQGLVETFILSAAGGLLGLGVAFAATHSLIAFVSRGDSYIAMSPAPDTKILLFTLAVSLFTGLLFGLAPAITAARTGIRGGLSSSARTVQSSGGRLSRFWPKTLVASQVVLSLLLVVTAGLFLRSLRNLQNQDYGFERSHLLLAQMNERLAGYAPHQVPALHQVLLERLAAIPGVRSAALSEMPPIANGAWSAPIALSGYTPAPKENTVSILNRVSGQYFETAGIPIVSGRAITPADTANSLKVAVINQTVARRFFPKGDAIGRQLTIEIDSVHGPWQIVGIAKDTKPGNPRDTDPALMTYIPLAQIEPYLPLAENAPNSLAAGAASATREENQDLYANTILLRTTGDPAGTISALRPTVAGIDPNLPILEVTTIREQVSNLISHDELISRLTAIFSVLALLLAAIGLYGVMAHNVARRANEIGIRLALGAQGSGVVRMILREALLLLAVGMAFGLPLTLLSTRILRQQLFHLNPVDPFTFAAAAFVIAGSTIVAAWLPARAAARVNPVAALRCD
jgi:predicted permease